MKISTMVLVVCCVASPALAGPNAGGTLVVHDTGLAYTSDLPVPPATDPPADCADVDHVAPGGTPTVWKIYAAFPEGSSPRLQALTLAINFTPGVEIYAAGLPDPAADFELPWGGWPDTDGANNSIVFGTLHTGLITECYWFGGYGENGALFASAAAEYGSYFGDDSVPALLDPIVGFSSLGFGTGGVTICPGASGACCFEDGTCRTLPQSECLQEDGFPQGVNVPCDPNPCPGFGACCHLAFGSCDVTTEADCALQGDLYLGNNTTCEPNPCPQPPMGACCRWDNSCILVSGAYCEYIGGDYAGDGAPCEPNPCPLVSGACCYQGACYVQNDFQCSYYGGIYQGDGTSCDPNPCPGQTGACCAADGTCTEVLQEACSGQWMGMGTECQPNPCPEPVPTERSSWGRIKAGYATR